MMKSTSLRSSVRDKIRWITLYFDGDDASTWFMLLKSLLLSLPPKSQFLVCCSEQAHLDILWDNKSIWAKRKQVKKTQLGQTLQGAKCYLHFTPHAEESMNIWCRDPFFFKYKTHNLDVIYLSKTGYASKITFPRFNVTQLDFPRIQIQESDDNHDGEALYLSGGNLLADEDFILVGYPEFQRTWNGTDAPAPSFRSSLFDEKTAVAALLAWANGEKGQSFRKVHLLGKEIPLPKPSALLGDKMFTHIDGYISLTGTYRTDSNGKKKYVLLIARIEQVFMPKNAQKTNWEGILVEWNTYLDAVAHQIEDIGDFEVWRNPIPLFALCYWDWDTARPCPTRPYLGLMNNALIKMTKFNKKVWLSALTPAPYLTDSTEALAIIEQANIAMWAALGFEVRVIHANFHPFWKWLGGLRCLTNHF